jgi:hypothetical protein
MTTDNRSGMCAAAALAVVLAAAGCGGSSLGNGGGNDGAAGAGGGGGNDAAAAADAGSPNVVTCGDPYAPIDPTAMLDDMEDGNFLILNIGGRNGAWWAGGDATPGGTIVPMGDAPPELIPGGRCGSKYAMRVTGQGFNDWGTVLSMSFAYGTEDGGAQGLLPYDGHIRSGITFWARIGDTSTDQVRFAVADKYARPEAGICVVNGPPGMTCYDTFGVQLTKLDATWRQYRIPFGGLTQRMFGVQAPTVDTTTLYDVEFTFGPGAIFDFWLDDISFY